MLNHRPGLLNVICYSLASGVALIIFALDLNLPLGVADGSLYVGLILIGLLALNRNLIIGGAITGSLLTVLGYFLSPPGGEIWQVLVNRIISLLTIWLTALICLKKQKIDIELQKIHLNLENKYADGTRSLNKININYEKKSNYLQLHKNIADKVNQDIDINEIFHFCLKEICLLAEAQIGHLYLAENRYSNRLVSGKIWYMEDESEFREFREITEQHIFETGIGFPGRVHEIREPVWIENIEKDLNFPRLKHNKNISVKSGFAFPLFIADKVTGVMEFFFNAPKIADHELLELMKQIGVQLGRALERRFFEEDRNKLLYSLTERVKELTCMSEVAKLITVKPTMDDILSSIESLIIPAWQFPDLVRTRISFNEKIFGSDILPESPWILTAPIVVNGNTTGLLEVCYSEKPPGTNDQVFLHEETNLLTWLGQTLSSVASKLSSAEALKFSNIELRSLYNKLENVRELERTRIAREIHDELGQALTIFKLDLNWLKQNIQPCPSNHIEAKLHGMMQHVDTTLQELNRITSELRPHALNVLGLLEALKIETEKFISLTGVTCNLSLCDKIPALHPDLATLIYRVYQEALTNIVRHSDANNVDIRFEKSGDGLSLSIKDDGVGFDIKKAYNSNSFGLTGMRERVNEWGGEFKINGAPGKGTQVFISVPIINIEIE